MQTFDGMLHKMNIMDNNHYKLVEKKDHMLFFIDNSGREYVVSTKNSKTLDYDLLDRVMKSI